MGLLPTQKPDMPQLVDGGVWGGGGGRGRWGGGGGEACVTTARYWMELGWDSWLMGVCVGGGGEWKGGEACVTTASQWMELGWGYYLPRNLPQLVDGCVCGGGGGGDVGGMGGGG